MHTTNYSHFTGMGLTLLNGNSMLCILILSYERQGLIAESGMDIFVDIVGYINNPLFFINDSGTNNRFHGGPMLEHVGES